MSKVIGALGFHTERVSEPAEVIPALRRALDVNKSGRPAYIAASTPSIASGLDGAQSETMPKLSGRLENAGTMCHDETQRTGGTP
jgi:thiamine pyrophosphate-dependent acetolactate synthase large subunit-like protein